MEKCRKWRYAGGRITTLNYTTLFPVRPSPSRLRARCTSFFSIPTALRFSQAGALSHRTPRASWNLVHGYCLMCLPARGGFEKRDDSLPCAKCFSVGRGVKVGQQNSMGGVICICDVDIAMSCKASRSCTMAVVRLIVVSMPGGLASRNCQG